LEQLKRQLDDQSTLAEEQKLIANELQGAKATLEAEAKQLREQCSELEQKIADAELALHK
jgi:hypothetical protein